MNIQLRLLSVLDGKIVDGTATTLHAQSCYERPVLTVDGEVRDWATHELAEDLVDVLVRAFEAGRRDARG